MTDQHEANPLPSDFWKAAEKVVKEPSLQLIHAQIVARLKEDHPEADTLTLLTIERIATVYCLIRQKEATGAFAHDRAYKETMAFWHQMTADLRKSKAREEVIEAAIAEAMSAMAQSVSKAMAEVDLPDEVKSQIINAMSEALAG